MYGQMTNPLMQLYMGGMGGGMPAPPPGYAMGNFNDSLAGQAIQAMIGATGQANQANQQRYDQGLGELTGLRDRSNELVSSRGGQRADDINRAATQRLAADHHNAVSRGLSASTNAGAMRRRTDEGRARSLNDLSDQLTRQRLDVDSNTTGALTDWIYRRDDVQPNINGLMQLAQMYGQSGMGQGYGGAGGAMGGIQPPPGYGQQQIPGGIFNQLLQATAPTNSSGNYAARPNGAQAQPAQPMMPGGGQSIPGMPTGFTGGLGAYSQAPQQTRPSTPTNYQNYLR